MNKIKEFCEKMIEFYKNSDNQFLKGKIEAYKEVIAECERSNNYDY